MSGGRSERPPADVVDATGGDLVELLAEYLTACDGGDVLTGIKAVYNLIEAAWGHLDVRLDEAAILGFDWGEIGQPLGLDAWHAYCELGDRCGPPQPSGWRP